MRLKGLAVLGISLILSSSVFGVFYYKSKRVSDETVRVTGAASRRISADIAKWRIVMAGATTADTLQDGYAGMRRDLDTTIKYLQFNGIDRRDIIVEPLSVKASYGEKGLTGFVFEQRLTACSDNVESLEKIARETTQLPDADVIFQSSDVEYYFSKLDDLRGELLEAATRDARKRAERIAMVAGGVVGPMVSARSGIFQVREPYSTETSDSGTYDLHSRSKDVSVTVCAVFALH